MQQTLSYKSSIIGYETLGTGKEILFCFHGYGLNATSFSFLEEALGKDYTLIAIDLPFHGNTQWNEGLQFLPDDLMAIMQQLQPNKTKAFSLLGFSMGGRVCLCLLEKIPSLINKVVLIAPDGLHNNFWQKLSTQTKWGNKLFCYFMAHPWFLFLLMKLAAALHLFNKNIVRFVHYYLDDAMERKALYKRWTTMRFLKPDLLHLKKILLQQKKHVSILFGKYDSVIVTKCGLDFKKGVEEFVTIKEIQAGHQLLKEKHIPAIVALFNE
jgi:pimeloyl-ACP methyl ester carboxylesterase